MEIFIVESTWKMLESKRKLMRIRGQTCNRIVIDREKQTKGYALDAVRVPKLLIKAPIRIVYMIPNGELKDGYKGGAKTRVILR